MKYNIDTLDKLPLNICGKVSNLACADVVKRRLLDLGLVKNTAITPVLVSPSKGVRAYWVRNSLIAIRDEDSSSVFINF